MKNYQKGFVVPLLIVIAVLVVGGGTFAYFKYFKPTGPTSYKNDALVNSYPILENSDLYKDKFVSTNIPVEWNIPVKNIAIKKIQENKFSCGNKPANFIVYSSYNAGSNYIGGWYSTSVIDCGEYYFVYESGDSGPKLYGPFDLNKTTTTGQQNSSQTPSNSQNTSITLLSPNGGENWVAGATNVITWRSVNIPSKAGISIDLINADSGDQISIAAIGATTTSYAWKIPTILNGSYKIEISTQGIGKKILDESNSAFRITGKTNQISKIDSLFPSSGALSPAVITGVPNTNEIKDIKIYGSGFLTAEDGVGANRIFFSSEKGTALFGGLSSDGKTLIINQLPLSLEGKNGHEDLVPGKYEIYVRNILGKSNSSYITLTEPSTPSITVIYPKGGESLKIGSTVAIKWDSRNIPVNGPRKIKIDLVNMTPVQTGQNSSLMGKVIFENLPNTGSVNWQISSNVAPGDYRLMIHCDYPYQNDCPGGDTQETFRISN